MRGFPTAGVMSNFAVQPQNTGSVLQEPSSEFNPVLPANTDECLSDGAHAKLLSGRVQLTDCVWIVDDNVRINDKLSDNSRSCTFPNCIHIMAVRITAGLQSKRSNLSVLRHTYRSGKKQGKKHGLDTVSES